MKIKRIVKNFISKTLGSGKPEKSMSSGEIGEFLACVFLKNNGYRIIGKNFRTRFGEIDIIAEDNKTICFVEVKSRSYTSYGLPEESVDSRKQEKIVKTALAYITTNDITSTDMRFDIVSVDLKKRQCTLIRNAFNAR